MLTPATFRAALPEFADAAKYPDPVVVLQLTVAYSLVNAERWGDLLDTGAGWLAAHLLVLATRDQDQAVGGRVPGTVAGVQTSKTVDKVSVSLDTSAVTMENAAFWNMTKYGIQYLTFARMMGAGGIQL